MRKTMCNESCHVIYEWLGWVVGGVVASPLPATMTPGGQYAYCWLHRVHGNRRRSHASWETAATGLYSLWSL